MMHGRGKSELRHDADEADGNRGSLSPSAHDEA